MPMGSKHDEVGRLNGSGGDLSLRLDGGGTWRLDIGLVKWWRARRLVGHRVRISGVRIGFDVLSVDRIAPVDPSA